jgi:hypothetical protein
MVENNISSNSPPTFPLRYEASFEQLEKGEEETDAALTKTMLGISETAFKDSGRGLRSVHAKSHGLLIGSLRVLDDLPAVLAQGVAASPKSYPVVVRLSTTPGDILDDSVSTPRALALKIIGVEGPRLVENEGGATQDFVLANGPAFTSATAKKFLGHLKLLAAPPTGPKARGRPPRRGLETVFEAFGHKSSTLTSLGGQRETHILGDTFYSQVPLLWGPYMAKVSVAPVSPELRALTDAPISVNGKPNGNREAVVNFFHRTGADGSFACNAVPTSNLCQSRMPLCVA